MAGDWPVLQDIIRSSGCFTAEEQKIAQEMVDDCLAPATVPREYEVAVAEDEAGQAAGYICYGPTPLTEGTMDLYWIAVHPARRKRGIGAALLRWMDKTALEQKARLVVIETSSTEAYASARRLYARMGYREAARIPDFYRPGDALVVYCKYFSQNSPAAGTDARTG